MASNRESEAALLAALFDFLDGFDSLIGDVDRDRDVVLIDAPDSGPPSPILITAAEFAAAYPRLLESAASDPSDGTLQIRAFRLFSVLLQEAAWDLSEPGRHGYKLVNREFVRWD
jgi:hypothetical protein